MSKTYFNVLKKDAVVNVPFTTKHISQIQLILLRHLDNQCNLDTASRETIESLCHDIDRYATSQKQFESKEVRF